MAAEHYGQDTLVVAEVVAAKHLGFRLMKLTLRLLSLPYCKQSRVSIRGKVAGANAVQGPTYWGY
jgi:hypothetical protein